ncbi:MAG TPA: response regulator transcription factor [Candidatus Acidoferrales bacterium]|nr:response regulator transcription factor [Candidatus Acidoferrales bacterium]
MTIKVLIVDDHPIVRAGLREALAAVSDIVLGGEAATAHEALRLVRAHAWDVVVLDIGLPDKSGLEVLQEIKSQRPQLPVLVLSMRPEDQLAMRVLKAGAAGYMTKESASSDLVAAIRKVYAGGKYVSPTLAEKLASALERPDDRLPHELLSDREYQVLCLIASGKTVKEVAERLHLSDNTISTYRARILDKMGMRTNAELTSYAVRNRLVD